MDLIMNDGNYGKAITLETLKEFHRRRVQVLAESGADLIAFETIPNKLKTEFFAELLEEGNISRAWFAFKRWYQYHEQRFCVTVADSCKKVVAVGINCTPPRFIHGLIPPIQKVHLNYLEPGVDIIITALYQVATKAIVIYPNSGETYDPDRKQWKSTGVSDEDFMSHVSKWHEAGASLIGGCCRTTPNTIRAIYKTLHVT